MTTKAPAMLAVLAALLLARASHAGSGAEQLLGTLKQKFPKTEFTKVVETVVPHLYEVQMGDNVAFVSDENARFFVLGRMFDTETLRDVTGVSGSSAGNGAARAVSIEPRDLPLNDAIKTVRGSGARTLFVFSDPACPYCKKLERELGALKDVTIYTFLVPFQGRSLPHSIWCAPDRARAWERLMTTGDRAVLEPHADCLNPLDRNLELANKLGVAATPTLIFNDGTRIDGYARSAEIESQLKTASSRPSTQASAKD